MRATSDVLCGTGIVNRAGDIDTYIAERIAAEGSASGVATVVAVGVATPAGVATPITAVVTRRVTPGEV